MMSLIHAASPKQILIDYNTILEIHRVKIMVYMKEIFRSYGMNNKWNVQKASGNVTLVGQMKQVLGYIVNCFAIARPTNRAGLYKNITLSDWIAGYKSFIVTAGQGPHHEMPNKTLPIYHLLSKTYKSYAIGVCETWFVSRLEQGDRNWRLMLIYS